MSIKFIFFDLGDTLIHKAELESGIKKILEQNNFDIPLEEIRRIHKLCRETTDFPVKTNKEFYQYFNSKFLEGLEITPSQELIDAMYDLGRELQWSVFDDVASLSDLNINLGILSNWDSTLPDLVSNLLPDFFPVIISSYEAGFSKPSVELYKSALDKVGLESSSVLMIGDSPKLDIFPALALGMQAVLLDRYGIFPQYPGDRIESLSQIHSLLQ